MGRKITFRVEDCVRGLTHRRCKKLMEELEERAETWEDKHNNPDKADSIRYCVDRIKRAMYETSKAQEEIPEDYFKAGVTNYGWICPVCGRGNGPFSSTCPCKPIEYVVTC